MKIATFGSCLSRYTANQYVGLFGGEVICSVYHNRSDAFVKRFLDDEWGQCDYQHLSSALDIVDDVDDDADIKPTNIIKNQLYDTIGCHRLKRGIPFFKVFDSHPDIFLLDNYIDLSARLVYSSVSPEIGGYFINMRTLKENQKQYHFFDDLLDPILGAKYMAKVISYIQKNAPQAKIFFLNFPYNVYQDEIRKQRSLDYNEAIKRELLPFDTVKIIDALDVKDKYRTKHVQHYKPIYYAAIAGIVKANSLG
ncbi:hypothetical protein [uncultured Salinicola sp.]|uniref:hypothetical protein n=1 Tax=uncultured Salinicola sp. TaxID=1193542 RepID=UPI002632BA36|nr:hypothetical protein [uncultured Salinicola sp.]